MRDTAIDDQAFHATVASHLHAVSNGGHPTTSHTRHPVCYLSAAYGNVNRLVEMLRCGPIYNPDNSASICLTTWDSIHVGRDPNQTGIGIQLQVYGTILPFGDQIFPPPLNVVR